MRGNLHHLAHVVGHYDAPPHAKPLYGLPNREHIIDPCPAMPFPSIRPSILVHAVVPIAGLNNNRERHCT
jgi:hypothetical protein